MNPMEDIFCCLYSSCRWSEAENGHCADVLFMAKNADQDVRESMIGKKSDHTYWEAVKEIMKKVVYK